MAVDDLGRQRVAAARNVARVVGAGRRNLQLEFSNALLGEAGWIKRPRLRRQRLLTLLVVNGRNNRLRVGAQHRKLVHHHRRRLLATADARCGDDLRFSAQQRRQTRQQILRTLHLATQAVTHPNGQRGRSGTFRQHFKVVIKSRHFVNLGHGHIGQFGQGHQMPFVQAKVGIVQQMQVLDQPMPQPSACRFRA